MSPQANPGLEEVRVTLNLLWPAYKRVLTFMNVKGFQGVRTECLVGQDKHKLIFFKGVYLSDGCSIKDASWLGRFVFGPSFGQINAIVGTVNEFSAAICHEKSVKLTLTAETECLSVYLPIGTRQFTLFTAVKKPSQRMVLE